LEFNVPFQHKYGYIRDDDDEQDDAEEFDFLLNKSYVNAFCLQVTLCE